MKNYIPKHGVFLIILCVAGTCGPFAAPARGESIKGMGYFAIGSAVMNIDDLNTRLGNAGFSALPDTFNLIGGGGFGVSPRRLILGGEGYGLLGRSVTSGAFTMKMDGGVGFFDIGYLLYIDRTFSVYPILGIGGGGYTLHIYESVNDFNRILANPRRESNVATGGFMLNLSVGGDITINTSGQALQRGGLVLGIRLGYLYSPWSSDWNFAGNMLSNSPSSTVSGPYLQFTLGGGRSRPFAVEHAR